jgi:outer membrane biogenesis lipoprotein LolB
VESKEAVKARELQVNTQGSEGLCRWAAQDKGMDISFFGRAGKTIKSLRNQQGKVQADVPKGKRECGMDKERPSEQLGPQVECMMAEQHRSTVVTYQTNGKKR